jgi:hypothetical protein
MLVLFLQLLVIIGLEKIHSFLECGCEGTRRPNDLSNQKLHQEKDTWNLALGFKVFVEI